MLLVHPAVDLFPAGYRFFRQGLIGKIGQQEGGQHQVFRFFELLFQQMKVLVGQGHPILRPFLQGQHAGQNGPDLSAAEL